MKPTICKMRILLHFAFLFGLSLNVLAEEPTRAVIDDTQPGWRALTSTVG